MDSAPYTATHDTLVRTIEATPSSSLAPLALVKLGVDLHGMRRIEALEPVSGGALFGLVRDANRRVARVYAQLGGDSLIVSCSCSTKGRCAHIVAVALAVRDRAPKWRAALTQESQPGFDPEEPPKDRDRLTTWVVERDVVDLAGAIGEAFVAWVDERNPRERDRVHRLRYQSTTLADVISLKQPWFQPSKALRALASSFLFEHAKARAAHLRALMERRWPGATDPRLAPHLARVLELRARLIERGQVSFPKGEMPRLDVAVETFPVCFHLSAQTSRGWYSDHHVASLGIGAEGHVALVPSEGPAPTGLNFDAVHHRIGAALAYEAVEIAADTLTNPDKATLAARLAHELTIPPWQRLVEQLGDGLERTAEPDDAPAFELGWRVALKGLGGNATLVPLACTPKVRGGWKNKQLSQELWALAEERASRPGDSAAFSACLVTPRSGSYDPGEANGVALALALPALVGHPRFFLRDGKDIQLTLRRGHLALATRDLKGGFQVGFDVDGRFWTAKELHAASARVNVDRALLLVDEEEATATLCPLTPTLTRAINVALRHADALPSEASKPFVEVALKARERIPLAVSAGLRGPNQVADPKLRLRLALAGDALTVAAVVKPSEDLASEVPGEGPPALYVERDGALVAVERDLAAERAAANALWAALGLDPAPEFAGALPVGDEALDLVRDLGAHPEVEVEWAGREQVTVAQAIQVDALRLEARSGKGRTWFAMHGEAAIEGGGAVPLAELLRAIRERQRYVKVDDGRWAEIDEALTRKMSALAKRDGKLPTLMAPLVADLEDAGATLEGFAALNTSLRRLRDARGLVVAAPSGLQADLRPYQREGFQWLARLATWAPGACLADDTGLGQKVQALALMLHRSKAGPCLVVAPTSVGFNWARETERFAPSLRARTMRSGAELGELGAARAGDVVITSYGLVARHWERLAEVSWGTLVVDEAQTVKNAATLRARALRELSAGFTLALTGTPVENRASELWSLFRLVAPGLLGSEAGFREDFAAPIERGDDVARAGLAALIAPFVLRRLKRDVAQDLPARTEVELEVVLKKSERARYEEIRKATLHLLDGEDGTPPQQRRFKALQALTRLRQLACHPGLLDPKWAESSSKLDALEELVTRLREEGHRALVFSQFTSFLAKVRERVEAMGVSYLYLDGQTPPRERQRRVDGFQAGEADLFLLSLKAGGTGLNLTAATYVIHLDPWWNPAVEDQATDRAHRIGQDQPVTVYRLIAKDTVEEGIVQLHGEKRELADALLAGSGSSASLSYDEMLALISGVSPELALVDDDAEADVAGPGGARAEGDADAPRPAKVIDLATARTRRAAALPAPAPTPIPTPVPPPTTPPSAPTPAPAVSPDEVLERFERTLEAATQAGEIAASTAGTYRSAGRRYLAYATERSLDGSAPATLDAYLQAIADGAVKAGKSQLIMARAAFKWIRQADEPPA